VLNAVATNTVPLNAGLPASSEVSPEVAVSYLFGGLNARALNTAPLHGAVRVETGAATVAVYEGALNVNAINTFPLGGGYTSYSASGGGTESGSTHTAHMLHSLGLTSPVGFSCSRIVLGECEEDAIHFHTLTPKVSLTLPVTATASFVEALLTYVYDGDNVFQLQDAFSAEDSVLGWVAILLADRVALTDAATAGAELAALIHEVLACSGAVGFNTVPSLVDALSLQDQLLPDAARRFFLSSVLATYSAFAPTTEQTTTLADTLLTEDRLAFVARLLAASELVTHDTLLGDPQRAARMADALLVAAATSSTTELLAAIGDDLALNEAFLYLARLIWGESLTLESTFSAEDVARILRLADTISLAVRNAAVLETTVSLVEALVLLAGIDNRYPLTARDAVVLADTLTSSLLGTLMQHETLQFIDSLNNGFVFLATSTDSLLFDDSQIPTLTALLRQPDVLAFIGRLPLGDEDYQAWVLNSDSLGVTQYTNFPFNSLADTPRGTFALSDTGLYELTGDDDDGAPIEALLRTGDLTFNSSLHKRVDRAYLYLTSTDDVYLKTISTHRGQRNEAWYRVEYRESADDGQTRRVRFGKGLRGTTWAFELSNVDGGDFDVRGAEVLPLQLTRRV